MPEADKINRRKVLKTVGAGAVASGALSSFSGLAAAKSAENVDIARLSGGDAKHYADIALQSAIYERIQAEVGKDTQFRSAENQVRVFRRTEDSDTDIVVSVPLVGNDAKRNRGSHGSDRGSRKRRRRGKDNGQSKGKGHNIGDIAVILSPEGDVGGGRASTSLNSDEEGVIATIKMYSVDEGGVTAQSQTVEEGPTVSSGVTAQSHKPNCSQCKGVADLVYCGPGCSLGYATICYMVGGGLAGAWCGALVGDLCKALDEKTCENGLNHAVCALLGYCEPQSSKHPCDQFPDGVDSPYCDG